MTASGLARPLRCIHPGHLAHSTPMPASHQVSVALSLNKATEYLTADFLILGPKPRVNLALPVGESVWGLWDWDVVELFISAGAQNTPYLELQLSPFGQHVELLIQEPRKCWDSDFRSGFSHHVTPYDGKSWGAQINVPLKSLGWNGDLNSLCGNAFAILGDETSRKYYSLFLPEQAKPDFHLPEHFKKLVE